MKPALTHVTRDSIITLITQLDFTLSTTAIWLFHTATARIRASSRLGSFSWS